MLNSSISSSDMKRFLLSIIAFFLLLGMGLVLSCFYLPSPAVENSMLAVQKTKLEQLSRIQGPRIILIGGSGLGMGMLTSELAKELNHPVYNMGLHAGLGLIYQLSAPPVSAKKWRFNRRYPRICEFQRGELLWRSGAGGDGV